MYLFKQMMFGLIMVLGSSNVWAKCNEAQAIRASYDAILSNAQQSAETIHDLYYSLNWNNQYTHIMVSYQLRDGYSSRVMLGNFHFNASCMMTEYTLQNGLKYF